MQLCVTIENRSFQHPFIVASMTNEGILGTDFLHVHHGQIDFSSKQFSLGGRMFFTKSGLSRNKCYRVSLAEKLVLTAGNRMRVAGTVPAGVLAKENWMVEYLSKPPGGKCVMVGRSLVECCTSKVTLEMLTHQKRTLCFTRIRILP